MTLREFYDAFMRCPGDGWLDWDEALLLACYAEATRGPIVEVGSYMGRSACLLAQLEQDVFYDPEWRRERRPVYCIDPWTDGFHSSLRGEEVYARFLENLERVPGHRVTPIRLRVEEVVPIPAGLVYLDGDHTYEGTRAQASFALDCGPKYIAAHDVGDTGASAKIALALTTVLGPWREKVNRLAVWEVDQ